MIAVAAWLLIWELVYLAVGSHAVWHNLLICSPLQTAERLIEMAGEVWVWRSTAMSMLRIVSGYVIGVALGTILAVLTTFVKPLYYFFNPIITLMKATPIASFIILAMLWFKSGTVPTFITVLIVLPLVWANVSEGLRSTDKQLLEMAKLYRLGWWKRIIYLYAPQCRSFFFSGCTTALGFAWKSGVAAEVLSLPSSAVGTELYYSKIYLETADLFAWTSIIIIMSVLLGKLLTSLLEKTGARK